MGQAVDPAGDPLEPAGLGVAAEALPGKAGLTCLYPPKVAGLALGDLVQSVIIWTGSHMCKTFAITLYIAHIISENMAIVHYVLAWRAENAGLTGIIPTVLFSDEAQVIERAPLVDADYITTP